MQPILGGYEYSYTSYGLLFTPSPAFFFVPSQDGGAPELFVNDISEHNARSHHFKINPFEIEIIVSNPQVNDQGLTFYAQSDCANYLN